MLLLLKKERRGSKKDEQVLLSENEFHIEKIMRKVPRKKGNCLYEVSWIGFDEHTMEPRENIPRILVELFERFGDSTVCTDIVDTFETQVIKYIKVACEGKIFSLPACSLQVAEEAYFLK